MLAYSGMLACEMSLMKCVISYPWAILKQQVIAIFNLRRKQIIFASFIKQYQKRIYIAYSDEAKIVSSNPEIFTVKLILNGVASSV